jgi:hypothetical protein
MPCAHAGCMQAGPAPRLTRGRRRLCHVGGLGEGRAALVHSWRWPGVAPEQGLLLGAQGACRAPARRAPRRGAQRGFPAAVRPLAAAPPPSALHAGAGGRHPGRHGGGRCCRRRRFCLCLCRCCCLCCWLCRHCRRCRHGCRRCRAVRICCGGPACRLALSALRNMRRRREARQPRARRCGRCDREVPRRRVPPQPLLRHVVCKPPRFLQQQVAVHHGARRGLPGRGKAGRQPLPLGLGASRWAARGSMGGALQVCMLGCMPCLPKCAHMGAPSGHAWRPAAAWRPWRASRPPAPDPSTSTAAASRSTASSFARASAPAAPRRRAAGAALPVRLSAVGLGAPRALVRMSAATRCSGGCAGARRCRWRGAPMAAGPARPARVRGGAGGAGGAGGGGPRARPLSRGGRARVRGVEGGGKSGGPPPARAPRALRPRAGGAGLAYGPPTASGARPGAGRSMTGSRQLSSAFRATPGPRSTRAEPDVMRVESPGDGDEGARPPRAPREPERRRRLARRRPRTARPPPARAALGQPGRLAQAHAVFAAAWTRALPPARPQAPQPGCAATGH